MTDEGTIDPRDAKIAELQAQLDQRAAADKQRSLKTKLAAIGAGILAALSSPEAVKAEKNLVALVLTRVAVLVPTAAGIVLVIIKALGGPDTGVTP